MRPRPIRRPLALASLGALTAAGTILVGLPAGAAPARQAGVALPAPSGPVQSVTLSLAPRDARALSALTTAKGLTRSERVARVEQAIPGTARAGQVAALARRLGLTVVSQDAFTVDVQAPASTVLAEFGSARAVHPQLPTAQALPSLPSALAGLVTVAVGGDDHRPALLSHQVRGARVKASSAVAPTDGSLSISQLRGINRVAATTAVQSASAPIVASLQFPSPQTQSDSGVAATLSDLSAFVTTNNVYGGAAWNRGDGKTANAAITAVTPDGGSSSLPYPATSSLPDCTDTSDYDQDQTADEVSLDQEAILLQAPQLRQRIYYAPNCGNSQDDAIQQVYYDVATNKLPIVALTTSWGECEPQVSAFLASDQTTIQALTGLGVAMFAAAGDTGSFDCIGSDGSAVHADAVDDPGSVPSVLSVGGTAGTLASTLTTWNNGDGFATGGGFSCVGGSVNGTPVAGYAAPSYQSTVSRTPSFPSNGFGCASGSAARQVPDIAADGSEGLDVIVTEAGSARATYRIYGTSLSAPLSAAGYAETLTNAGKGAADVAAAGGLPQVVYGATQGLVDVTRGTNGDYHAGPGWDPTTGLGTPQWPVVLSAITGAATPTYAASLLPVNQRLLNGQRLQSPDGTTELDMQTDGNLVLYDVYAGARVPIFGFSTNGNVNDYAVLQSDGNFVVYSAAGKALRGLSTNAYHASYVALLGDGGLSGLTAGKVPVFSRVSSLVPTGGGTDHLPYLGVLAPGSSITSPDGSATATMQPGGNLVVTKGGTTVATLGNGVAGSIAQVQYDGDLIVDSRGGQPSFHAGAVGNPHDTLSIRNDGSLALTAASGQTVWTSTGGLTGQRSDTLTTGQRLGNSQALWDVTGTYRAVMQSDGNVVVYAGPTPIFSTGKHAPGAYLVLQGDGNLVEYAGTTALYATGTSGRGGTRLVMQSDGNLVLYAGTRAVWSSKGGRVGG